MGVKWFLCTQSLWKNDTERSFFAVLLSVVFLCLKVNIKLNFRHIAIGWVTPHRWKIHFRQLCREAWFPPWVFLFVPWDFCLCREVFVCAVEFLFVPWQFFLCREIFVCTVTVFVCAVEFLYVPWHPWATVLYGPAQKYSTCYIFLFFDYLIGYLNSIVYTNCFPCWFPC